MNRLEKLGYLTLSQRPVLRCREIKPAQLDGPLVLNEEQQSAYEGLNHQRKEDHPGVAVLYGITGFVSLFGVFLYRILAKRRSEK